MLTGERGHDRALRVVQLGGGSRGDRLVRSRGGGGARGQACDQVGLDVEHGLRGQRADVFGHAGAVQQRDALGQRTRGEVLGKFGTHRGAR